MTILKTATLESEKSPLKINRRESVYTITPAKIVREYPNTDLEELE